MAQVSDPYLRERWADLEDLTNRLQQQLAGRPLTAAAAELPEEFVLVARGMGPAELLDYDRRRLKGLVLEEGSPSSHVAVVARALDIPVVGRVKDVLARVENGDLIVVNGDEAAVLLRPSEDVQQAVANRIALRLGQREQYAALRGLPAETVDGARVELLLNAGLFVDLPDLPETGAVGIGLFRTELQFMLRDKFPTVAQQSAIYRRVLDQAGTHPVTFRTLDIGGDKLLPYMDDIADENPAMGWRAIRIALDRPAMLRQQLRALIRAAAGRTLQVMFPMIADVAEFEAARAILDLELDRQREAKGELPAKLEVGLMLEVPALLWQLPALCARADFISVGTNDLVQFLFAADRGNPRVADRYDPLSPASLKVLGEIASACAAQGTPVTVCGEMAGRPIEAMALIGLGFRALSMAPAAVGPIKAMIRSLDIAALTAFIDSLADVAAHSFRGKFHDFARDRGISL
jgi:phosphotransferase system, enzyme I, PtsP